MVKMTKNLTGQNQPVS